jgi:hypothetical protein
VFLRSKVDYKLTINYLIISFWIYFLRNKGKHGKSFIHEDVENRFIHTYNRKIMDIV